MDERLKRLDELLDDMICGNGLVNRVRALERFRWTVLGGATVLGLIYAGVAGKSIVDALLP
jgi:hypothetical protein